MSHLSHDEFVLAYYGEPELGSDRREHLDHCGECRAELASLAAVLDRVTPAEVPEPEAGYEARVWDRVQWRLRGERRAEARRSTTTKWLAAAAMLAIAFTAGILVNRRISVAPTPDSGIPSTIATASNTEAGRDRILLVVVGEHFDESERVLVELTNLDPDGATDMTAPRARAQDLLASNRLYRTSAADRGEESVATLLDELEPVLMQIAHAPAEVSETELRKLQKRVETKGLVFKLRVVRADVKRDAGTTTLPTNI
jgi:hypothetical protein